MRTHIILFINDSNYLINDEGMEIISSQISKYLKNLQVLLFDLGTTRYRRQTDNTGKKLTAQGLKVFTTNLGTITQLKKLIICFTK